MSHSNWLKKGAKRQFFVIGSFVGVENKQAFVSYGHKNSIIMDPLPMGIRPEKL